LPVSRKITGVAGFTWATRSSSTADSVPKDDTTAMRPGKISLMAASSSAVLSSPP